MPKVGVLFIHGFTGHRSSLEPIIPELERCNFEWHYPILAGHGTSPHDMKDKRWLDWHKDVKLGVEYLLQSNERVIIIALSMGALLAIECAAEQPQQVAGIVLISPCVIFKNPLAKFTPLLSPIIKRMPFHPKEKFSSREYAKRDRGYRWFPTQPYYSYWQRAQTIFELVGRINCPVRIIQSRKDAVADPRGAQQLFDTLQSPKELFWHERSGHEMVIDCEAEVVIQEVLSFQPLRV